jgi:hypothetical protein
MAGCPLSQLRKTSALISKTNIDGIHTKACFELAIVRETGFAVHEGRITRVMVAVLQR